LDSIYPYDHQFELLEPTSLYNMTCNIISVIDKVGNRGLEIEEEMFLQAMSKLLSEFDTYCGSYLFEIYTTARMLRKFNQKTDEWFGAPRYSIFYGGEDHVYSIGDMLDQAGFNRTELDIRRNKVVKFNKYSINDPKCVDIQHMKYFYQFFE